MVGVDTSDGPIDTEHVVLTGGPKLAEVGATAGARVPAGGARHQVVVTAPVTAFDVHDVPMVFDLPSGIYWRPGEAGGLLWGMSNPEEAPGVAADFDEIYYQKVRDRIEELLPGLKGLGLRRTWAATIDYTPDHLPILGPLLTDDGPVEGTVVASPAGHGMMWGPAVAEVAADLTMTGRCDWLDLTDLGLDRFDADGNSRVAPEPISLPFPEKADECEHDYHRNPCQGRRRRARGLGPARRGDRRSDGDPRPRDVGRRRQVGRHLAVHTGAVVLGSGRERGRHWSRATGCE